VDVVHKLTELVCNISMDIHIQSKPSWLDKSHISGIKFPAGSLESSWHSMQSSLAPEIPTTNIITRNSPEDEIANVNFFHDIVHVCTYKLTAAGTTDGIIASTGGGGLPSAATSTRTNATISTATPTAGMAHSTGVSFVRSLVAFVCQEIKGLLTYLLTFASEM